MTTGIGIESAAELTPRDFERLLLRTLTAMKKGDFKVRMPVEFTGTHGKIADTLNDILELNERSTLEVERVATVVGKEGKLSHRAQVSLGPSTRRGDAMGRGARSVAGRRDTGRPAHLRFPRRSCRAGLREPRRCSASS